MKQEQTQFDRIISRIKNNPVVASAIVFGVIVIAVATFTGAVKTLISLTSEIGPEEARLKLGQLSLEYTPEAFFESTKKGDVHAVKLFLSAEMNPNVKDKYGNTALMFAIRASNIPIINALLKAKINVNETNRGGVTALSWTENENTMRILLDNGADTNAINEAFISAARSGSTFALHILIDEGAEVNKIGSKSLLGAAGSTLVSVIEKELNDTVRLLLDLGVDVNVKTENGWTSLLLAEVRGRTSMLQLLLDRGADVNAKCVCPGYLGGGWTALMMGISNNHDKNVAILLGKGADVNERNNKGETALMLASEYVRTDIVRALLAAGARVNEKDKKGRTALYFAKSRNNAEIIKLLQ